MAIEEDKNNLQSALGNILARPDALQEILGVVSKLKESGMLENLLPLLGSLGNGSGEKTESADDRSETGPENADRFLQTSATEQPNDSTQNLSQDSSTASGLSLLGSLLSGGGFGKSDDHKGDDFDGDKREDPSPKRKRYEDHRRLLQALRPYLGNTRRERIDFILKLLQFMELAGQIGLKDLFSGSK